MQRHEQRLFFSPNDLADFAACKHAITLGLRNLDDPIEKREVGEELAILQKRAYDHESAYLDAQRQLGLSVYVVEKQTFNQAVSETQRALKSGVDLIVQAAFEDEHFRGYADFLRRVERPSTLGSFSYEVIDTKLATKTKVRHLIQILQYADMLKSAQGCLPKYVYIALGNDETEPFRVDDYRFYVDNLRMQLLRFSQERPQTKPEKCSHCAICPWTLHCEAQWVSEDHLNQVARISKAQINRLNQAGIPTLKALANADLHAVNLDALSSLQTQARLQLAKRENNVDGVFIRPQACLPDKGFGLLPKPNEGDLFFDMEGYPHEKGGLEYLFGVVYLERDKPVFKAFWAHDRQAEKLAFEGFIDFVTARIEAFPDLHIYHYADYERRALRHLMSIHATREREVDQLLRERRLVDLYAVVRDAIQTSEPRYSIKNLEAFYMKGERDAEVKNAGASIVFYERWRTDRDEKWLKDIETYNYEDCISTQRLHQWLIKLRADAFNAINIAPFWRGEQNAIDSDKQERSPSAERLAIAEQRQRLRSTCEALQMRSELDEPSKRGIKLIGLLLDFFWREAKPSWWRRFDRQTNTIEELLNDMDVLAGITLDPSYKPEAQAQSLIYRYRLPDQDHRLGPDDRLADIATLTGFGLITSIDDENGWVMIKLSKRSIKDNWPNGVPSTLSVSREESFSHDSLDRAILRVVDDVTRSFDELRPSRYCALWSLLSQRLPSIVGVKPAEPLRTGADVIDGLTKLASGLDRSYLVVQGPPGTGKTYTGARVILNLLKQGKRVGISALSHNAIANLVEAVIEAAKEQDFKFVGARKGDGHLQLKANAFVEDVKDATSALSSRNQLVAGTAWLFASIEADQSLDYLFVDEAGQTSLANLVAMGTSARNLVLLGDPMQLGQPLQGSHPEPSGLSALEYVLQGHATVPLHLGVLLERTYRMHPAICGFISDVVYEGRLKASSETALQVITLPSNQTISLPKAGIVFDAIEHSGCSQTSEQEAKRIRDLIDLLVTGSYTDTKGMTYPISPANIMVVAPYNAQVKCIKQFVGESVKVGTVDRFQGQEAEIVIISMTTSSGEDMPRDISFLLDKRRLNVAISRAKSLAIVVSSSDLMNLHCSNPEQMSMVNNIASVETWSSRQTNERQ